jgi:cyclomaltodextrinase / maltogenic alpha-amylase / neopullulanase
MGEGRRYLSDFPRPLLQLRHRKKAVPVDRILRADWGGEPLWEPDEHGRINEYDYFGGDLNGITQKLPELKALGVTCIYLNPIFEAHSNHRYDTADYLKIDPLLGDENDFALLCERALENGIRVVLDGVFSHTGADSRYFNKNRRYPPDGAYNSKKSPYYPWYKFNHWPDDYKSWWGIEILPEINEEDPAFIEFIAGENGIARKWLNAGASGWRLDVADELPDRFLEAFRKAVKSEKPDVYILGEVWEDASNKSSYGCRRRYLHGHQLDSVMNYPFSSALIEFMQSGSAEVLEQRLLGILENYPPPAIHTLMNHIGTHDTVRVLTLLAGAAPVDTGKHARAREKLNAGQMTKGIALMKLITALQFTLPGVPCVYYGDEAGMQGGQDPFNRGCYPWGSENRELLAHYKALGEIRKVCPALADGIYETVTAEGGLFAFERSGRGNRVLTVVNRGVRETDFVLDNKWLGATVLLGKEPICGSHIKISVNEAVILTV